MKSNCYKCIYMRRVPGDCHIRCVNPDPEMKGVPHGVKNGWFFYPSLFDPTWMAAECNNFKSIDDESVAISSARNPDK